MLWKAYRMLSILNTIGIILSGNPKRIAGHLARRYMVKRSGRLFK